jgi:peptidylprolyl isomerase domain and WD repeat-containing protein 1
MYEKSYMHREVVTHVVVTPATDFVVTASSDGHVKFWKKMAEGVEFVKHFHAHLGPIHALVSSSDGLRLCTTGGDKAVKFFEVVSFDMSNMLRLEYVPTAACWCHTRGAPVGKIALAAMDSPLVRVYATDGATAGYGTPLQTVSLHRSPVVVLAVNETKGVCVSGDERGVLEYWPAQPEDPEAEPHTLNPSTSGVSFRFKMDTDLFDLAKVIYLLLVRFLVLTSNNKGGVCCS